MINLFNVATKRLAGGLLVLLLLSIPAQADWRDEVGTFRVGVLAGPDVEATMARVEPFRLALEETLGIGVEIYAARDAAALINASVGSRIEYAVLSATAFAVTWERCACVEPLVIARSADGSEGFNEIIVTRIDGPARLSELTGKRIAAVASQGYGGFDIALAEMKADGLDIEAGDATIRKFATGEEALAALRDGEVDAMIGWSSLTGNPSEGYGRGTLRRIAEREGDANGYRIAWRSTMVPNRMHAVRRNLPGQAKTRLRDLLTRMFDEDPLAYDSVEPFYGGGFVAARQGQFTQLGKLIAGPGKATVSDNPAR